jgi:hypothetical protein
VALDIAQTLDTQMTELGWKEGTPGKHDDQPVRWINE